ncbi:MAG: sensor histidine kinase [Hydrogenophaga sp.]|uniref:sensor histidine kinase n=1 Tax=Hydrogenophaga sp. TaxID=1904254 RepID=UPI001D588DC4|nr:sensor histidine kinase [Hydrogenophaga sp.]MBX3608380.1 sensor histidine kinase [Hydrogenophaga sp.]
MALLLATLATIAHASVDGAFAEVVVDRSDTVDLVPHLSYFEDVSGQWRPDRPGALTVAQFLPMSGDGRRGYLGVGEHDVWFRVQLRTTEDAPVDWFWVIEQPTLPWVEVRSSTEAQPARWLYSGIGHSPSERAWPHRWQVVPLELPPDATTTVYMHVRVKGDLRMPVRLWRPATLARHDQRQYALHSLCFGVLVGLLAYNLLTCASIRDAANLWCLGAFCMLGVYLFSAAGFLAQSVWMGGVLPYQRIEMVSLSAGCALLIQFGRSFLKTVRSAPRIDRGAVVLLGAWGLFALMYGTQPAEVSQWSIWAMVVLSLLLGLVMVTDGVLGHRAGSRPVAAAWVCLVAGLLIPVIDRFEPLPLSQWVATAPLVSVAVALVLLSFALADRLRVERLALEREREVAARADLARGLARQAQDEKSRFLAAVAHDLRQPLYAVTLAAEVLRRAPAPDQSQVVLEQMHAALETADGLLDSVMTVARLETGTLEPSPAVCRLDKVMDRVDLAFGAQAEAKGLRWVVTPSVAFAYTDEVLLQRVVFNLVANAVAYTDKGGVIVSCRQRAERILLQVWDTGPGLALDGDHPHFDRRFRGEFGTETDSGVGLGLVIAQRTAALLGIDMQVRSRLGRGTCFSLHLPGAAATLALSAQPV